MTKNTEKLVVTKSIVDDVLARVTLFEETGELTIPKDYSPQNALKSAYLILSESVDKDKNPVLSSCTKVSIANSLLDMVVQGLSPMKNQCYFIPYGGKLQMSRSYLGAIAVAKRVGLKNIVANVIFQDDDFEYAINNETGLKSLVKHGQNIENIDIKKIRGAYAITTMEDGTSNLTIMTITQIQQSWMQGYAKGNSGAHTNFTDEMCKKTVINRACKPIINSSTDVLLNSDDDSIIDKDNLASMREIELVDEDILDVEQKPEAKKKEPVKAEKKAEPDF